MNPTNGLFETLVAAAALASENLKYSNALLESIYWDYQSIDGVIGQTLNVNVPTVDEGDTSDIGSGPLNPTDTAHNTFPIVLANHLSTSFVIKTFDKIRTPADLEQLYVKPRMESLLRKANRQVVNMITAANFATNATIAGALTNEFARTDLGKAWAALINQGAPEEAGFVMAINPTVYQTMLTDTSFYQENIVGIEAAVAAQQKATIAPQFNCRIRWDQQIGNDSVSGKPLGLFFHPYAMAGVSADPPSAGDPSVKETIVFPKPNLPVQIQMQYSLRDQGTLVHLHCMIGTAVVRQELGQFMHTN